MKQPNRRPKKGKKKQPHDKKQQGLWNILIGVEVVLYIVLTTAIFVVHKKIDQLKAQQDPGMSTPQKTKSLDISGIQQQHRHELEKKVKAHPEDSGAAQQLAALHYRQGNTRQAAAQYQQILQHNPQDAQAHFALAKLYMGDRTKKAAALRHLQKVLELKPDHPGKKIITLWIRQLKKK